jgi:hypothetical protein
MAELACENLPAGLEDAVCQLCDQKFDLTKRIIWWKNMSSFLAYLVTAVITERFRRPEMLAACISALGMQG